MTSSRMTSSRLKILQKSWIIGTSSGRTVQEYRGWSATGITRAGLGGAEFVTRAVGGWQPNSSGGTLKLKTGAIAAGVAWLSAAAHHWRSGDCFPLAKWSKIKGLMIQQLLQRNHLPSPNIQLVYWTSNSSKLMFTHYCGCPDIEMGVTERHVLLVFRMNVAVRWVTWCWVTLPVFS
jgi:hypothetical protein